MSTKLEDLNEEEEYLSEYEESEYEEGPVKVEAYDKDMKDIFYKMSLFVYDKVKDPLVVLLLCLFFMNTSIKEVFVQLNTSDFFINLYTSILITLFFSIIREFI